MNLAIYCAGGLGKEIYDLAQRNNSGRWEEIFFVDDAKESSAFYGTSIQHFVSIQDAANVEFVIANGEPFLRKLLLEKVIAAGFKLATIVDKTAVISPTATLSDGCLIQFNCFVSSNVTLERNVYLQANALIGHDSIIGEDSVVSSFTQISGNCRVENHCYIGVGCSVKEGLTIQEGCIIGMGSNVFSDIDPYMVALGSPARAMKRNEEKRVFNRSKKV